MDATDTTPPRSTGLSDAARIIASTTREQNITDTGTRLENPPKAVDDRATCPHCRGTGKVLTVNDYLAELVGMLPASDAAAMDTIVAEFYQQLLLAAAHLSEFFPEDLTTGDALNSKGNRQRDQLLHALTDILVRYDPDHPDSPAMQSLRTNAKTWGRTHAWWRRADGTVYVPSEEDYLTVRSVLAGLLRDKLGDKFQAAHYHSLVRAYRSVSLWMQEAADEWRMGNPQPAFPRRRRNAAPKTDA